MNKILELLAKYLAIPLIKELVEGIVQWFRIKKRHKEIDAKVKKKVDKLKKDPNERNFDNLP